MLSISRRLLIFVLLTWLTFITYSNAQVTRFVSTTGTNNDPATALSWTSSTTNLQGTINASAPGDQVWVAQGVYKPTAPTGPASRTVSFSMKSNVGIYGGFVGNEINLSQRPLVNPAISQYSSSTLSGDTGIPDNAADNSFHVINNPAGLISSALLDGFVITAGNANGSSADSYGGGMYNNGRHPGPCSPAIQNCLFTSNSAQFGGAMYNNAGPATLNGSGGSCNPVLTNCSFLRNTATRLGGAIYSFGSNQGATSNPTLIRCTFLLNSASGGGAVYNHSDFYGTANPTLIACIFDYNTAGKGGAVMSESGYKGTSVPVMTNCSFFRNTAIAGGAYYNLVSQGIGSPQFTNCSFQSNQGVIHNDGYLSTVQPMLTNCVVFRNGAEATFTNLYGATVRLEYSLVDNTVTGYTPVSSLTTVTSPFLNSVSTKLSPCSPAINTGLSSATGLTGISTDLAGNPRIAQDQVDMGAYEFGELPSMARYKRLYVNASATGTNSGLDWANAFIDLQAALFYPCVADTLEIWVAGGTYKPTTTTSRDMSFALRNNVTIYGGFTGNETALHERPILDLSRPLSTTLSGDIGNLNNPTDNSYHVISNPASLTTTAVLDGFVITGGNADDNVLNGTRRLGGGIYNNGRGNYCNPTIRNCSFVNNSASLGGAIHNEGRENGMSNPTIVNCLFLNNTASSGGGAVFNSGPQGVSSPVITNCAFVNNTSTTGGAMYNFGEYGVSSPLLNNCSFVNNLADYGGVVYSSGYQGASRTTLNNCLTFNSVDTGEIDFKNTFGSTTIAQYSLFGSGVGGYASGPGNLTTTAFPFVSPTNLQLNPSSPALNAGNPASSTVLTGPYSVTELPATDLANQARIVGTQIDMGAYEYQAAAEASVRSAQDGLWNDPATWLCGCVPRRDQVVIICHKITLPSAYQALCSGVKYGPAGRIILNTSSGLRLNQ